MRQYFFNYFFSFSSQLNRELIEGVNIGGTRNIIEGAVFAPRLHLH